MGEAVTMEKLQQQVYSMQQRMEDNVGEMEEEAEMGADVVEVASPEPEVELEAEYEEAEPGTHAQR